MLNAGVIYENIYATERGRCIFDHGVDFRGLGYIGRRVSHLHAILLFDFAAISVEAPKPLSMTLQPSPAKARAIAKPIPLVEPVITADSRAAS
jgi:hypothetical protein